MRVNIFACAHVCTDELDVTSPLRRVHDQALQPASNTDHCNTGRNKVRQKPILLV